MRTWLTIGIIVLALVVIAGGITSVVLGHSNQADLTKRLSAEDVSLRVFDTNAPASAVVTNAAQAQEAANTLDMHRKKIAPTYSALLKGGKFDPTNPTDLTYEMAMTLEGQMNMAVLAFGLTTVLTFFGAVLIVIGVVLLIIGFDIFFYHVRPKWRESKAASGTATV